MSGVRVCGCPPPVGRLLSALPGLFFLGCEPAREAPRVERLVVVDGTGAVVDFTTDLGFEVTLTEARVMVQDFEFATAGELHSALPLPSAIDFFVTPAYAHPGHYEGGEVIGELQGRFLVDWSAGAGDDLGPATLIVGSYTSVNFAFARAELDDGLGDDDPLLGHTALLAGTARDGDTEIDFEFLVDAHEERLLVGAPFQANISEDDEVEIGFLLLAKDSLGDDTVFDGLDFTLLDVDGDGQLLLDPQVSEPSEVDAYNELRRRLETHNHYAFAARAEPSSHGGSP